MTDAEFDLLSNRHNNIGAQLIEAAQFMIERLPHPVVVLCCGELVEDGLANSYECMFVGRLDPRTGSALLLSQDSLCMSFETCVDSVAMAKAVRSILQNTDNYRLDPDSRTNEEILQDPSAIGQWLNESINDDEIGHNLFNELQDILN